MSFKLKKYGTLLIIILLSFASMQITASAMISPHMAVQISMTTDAGPNNEVQGGDEINAVVTWRSVMAPAGEPITIQVTDGAEILINSEEDITFSADGLPAPVNSIVRSPDGNMVTFMSGIPATSPAENQLSFAIKAPSNAVNFGLSVKIGADAIPANPATNFVQQEFSVKALLVSTSLDIIFGDTAFDIYGEVNYEDAFMIAMEVRNKETGDIAYGTTTMDLNNSGNNLLGTFAFDNSHPAGIYVVEAMLLDSSFVPVATEIKEIEHRKYSEVPISYKYVVSDTGEIIDSHTVMYNYGDAIRLSPYIIYSKYRLNGVMLNGQLLQDSSVVPATEPAEVEFLYTELFGISVQYARDNGVFAGEFGSHGFLKGSTVMVTANSTMGIPISVTVNGQPAPLINVYQVEVTITGNMLVKFLYK